MRWIGLVGMVAIGACGDGGSSGADAAPPDAIPADDSAFPRAMCGPLTPTGSGGGGTNPNFVTPTAVTEAYRLEGGEWQLVGPANWSCLGDGTGDAFPAEPVDASGLVIDFQTEQPVADAQVEVTQCSDRADQLDLATSGATGQYGLDIDIRLARWNILVSAVDRLDTFLVNEPVDTSGGPHELDLRSLSNVTANALPAFIGQARTPGLGLTIGTIVDCDGNQVANAAVTVSAQSGMTDHLAGAQTFYFSALSTSLPVRPADRDVSNTDGMFMVIEMTPTAAAYIQVWGFVDGQTPGVDPLTLLSEVPVPILADSFVSVYSDPSR